MLRRRNGGCGLGLVVVFVVLVGAPVIAVVALDLCFNPFSGLGPVHIDLVGAGAAWGLRRGGRLAAPEALVEWAVHGVLVQRGGYSVHAFAHDKCDCEGGAEMTKPPLELVVMDHDCGRKGKMG